jgi:hypothetical protein
VSDGCAALADEPARVVDRAESFVDLSQAPRRAWDAFDYRRLLTVRTVWQG